MSANESVPRFEVFFYPQQDDTSSLIPALGAARDSVREHVVLLFHLKTMHNNAFEALSASLDVYHAHFLVSFA
jgi:hypothetical protein